MFLTRIKNKTKDAQGIKITDSLSDLAIQADILFLAVKPQDFDGVLTELKDKNRGKADYFHCRRDNHFLY